MKNIFEKIGRYFRGRWHLAVLDEEAGRWTVEPDPANISYMKAQNANGRHVLLQPLPDVQPFYLLADDIGPELLRLHHRDKDGRWKPGRMIVETSPRNFQVWIRSGRFLRLDEKRHWLARLRSDPGADPKNRWGRCPGFRNRKAKHRDERGGCPLAKLIWIDWRDTARIPALSPPPRGGVCRKDLLSRADYNRGDESAADFSYALSLARRGCSDDEIAKRILEERSDWNNHKGDRRLKDYLARTVSRARRHVEKT